MDISNVYERSCFSAAAQLARVLSQTSRIYGVISQTSLNRRPYLPPPLSRGAPLVSSSPSAENEPIGGVGAHCGE